MSSSVQILVVAFHGADDLQECLAPLTESYEVLVVDNSADPEVAAVASRHGARYRDAGSNLGFAAAVNLGVSVMDAASDILLLNPDAVIAAADVAALAAALETDPKLAAVSPRLVGTDGHPQRAAWPFPSPARMWWESLGLARLRSPADEFVVGACLLLRRQALNDVGGFDERFFLYNEETDWQRRAAQLGWIVRLVPELVARHRGAGTSSNSIHREQLFHAGTETYIRKWFGSSGWSSYRAAVLVGAVVRLSLGSGPTRASARQRLAIYWRGPRRIVDSAGENQQVGQPADVASSSRI